MPGAKVYSVEIGQRSGGTAGDISATTGLPVTSGVTFHPWVTVEDGRAQFGGGTERANTQMHGRRTPGDSRPAATALINRSGGTLYGASDNAGVVSYPLDSLELSGRLRSFGNTTLTATPEGVILGSVMTLRAPAAGSFAASATGADAGQIPVADTSALDIEEGDILYRVDANTGWVQFREVTFVDDPNDIIYVHPHWETIPDTGFVYGVCQVWYPKVGNVTDFHTLFNMGDSGGTPIRRLAPMCALGSLGLTFNEDDGAVIATWGISPKVMLTDDSNASIVSTTERTGPIFMGERHTSIVVGADHSTSSAPISAAATDDSRAFYKWSATAEFTIGDSPGDGRSIVFASDRNVNNATLEMVLELEDGGSGDVFIRNVVDGAIRWVAIQMGHGAAPTGDTPTGFAICGRMARTPETTVQPDGDENIRRTITLRAVTDGPNLSAATTALALAPWKIAVPQWTVA